MNFNETEEKIIDELIKILLILNDLVIYVLQ